MKAVQVKNLKAGDVIDKGAFGGEVVRSVTASEINAGRCYLLTDKSGTSCSPDETVFLAA